MSTAAIIVIVVVIVVILIALFVLMPRMRGAARVKRRESELEDRRDQVAGENRAEAEVRERRADEAQRRARIAEQEAQRERAEANLHEERAELHERGMADHELIGENEREKFAGTSAVPEAGTEGGAERGPAGTEDLPEGQRRRE